MPRYIDADKAVEQARLVFCKDCNSYNGVMCRACALDDALDFIDDFPEADVIPKSKYDLVVLERAANVAGFIEQIAKVKRDTARKIFDDIGRLLDDCPVGDDDCQVSDLEYLAIHDGLAELKKKYTGTKEGPK